MAWRFRWTKKLNQLKDKGDVVTVYYNKMTNVEIIVKRVGYNISKESPEYVFLYYDGTSHRTSCRFLRNLSPVNKKIEDTLRFYRRHTISQEKLEAATKIETEGLRVQFEQYTKYKTVYDNMFDDVGHEEVDTYESFEIVYVGKNPKNGHREYVFGKDYNFMYDIRFEILD